MIKSDFLEFIWQHREDDPRQLALSGKKYPGSPMAELASQVQVLQKIRYKIPGWYRPGMYFPFSLSVEQASSEATARFKAGLVHAQTMADLTGGMGVDAFFFAQKVQSLIHIEQNELLQQSVKHNFDSLGVSNVQWYAGAAESFLAGFAGKLDLIYLDPARRHEQKGKVFQLSDCTPDVLSLKETMLRLAPRVLLKTAPLLDLKQATEQLGCVSAIWVLAIDGECREVLYLLERNAPASIPITAVHLHGGQADTFSFTWEEERQAKIGLRPPQRYLYEPNAAILKAGAFKSFAQQYGLGKLHQHTHLYTSETLAPNIPGRCFVIEQICKYDRKAVQAAVPEGKANITCRNFPDTPDQVRKKLGLKDGGEIYLFAATVADQQKMVIVCRKVGLG
jgi:hypothetical protein